MKAAEAPLQRGVFRSDLLLCNHHCHEVQRLTVEAERDMRALTRADRRKKKRNLARLNVRLAAGEFATPEEYQEAKRRALEGVGTPIDPNLVAQAIREHGDLGLGALDVAAEWSLAQRKNPPVSLQRKTPEGARPRSSRRCTTSGSSCDGPRREPDDEPPLVPLPRRVPADRLVPLIHEQLQRGRTVRDLARRAGVPERRLRSILAGDQTHVSFGVADALVTHALGGPTLWLWELADLYGAAA